MNNICGYRRLLNVFKGVVLILLFLECYVSATLFMHSHYDSRGSLIVRHSHPYSSPEHSHSGEEIIWIDLFSSFDSEAASDCMPDLSAPVFFSKPSYCLPLPTEFQQFCGSIFSRGPPVSVRLG